MKGLEVKNILFGELKQISSEEFRDSTGMNMPWDGLVDSADVKLILSNNSKETKKAYIHVIARPDMLPTVSQFTNRTDVEVKPGEEKEVSYIAPMFGIPSSDYKDYAGPWRCAVEVTVSDSTKGKAPLKKVKYYDIPAKVEADELEKSEFDIHKALDELEKTTVFQDFHLVGSPKDGVKFIRAKLVNFGENIQYIGIDMRAERRKSEEHQWGYGGQFFYEVGPKEEIPVDIKPGSCLTVEIPLKYLTGMEYLRIIAVSIPEYVFKSQKARAWFIWRSYEEEENYKSLIAKFDFYFKQGG